MLFERSENLYQQPTGKIGAGPYLTAEAVGLARLHRDILLIDAVLPLRDGFQPTGVFPALLHVFVIGDDAVGTAPDPFLTGDLEVTVGDQIFTPADRLRRGVDVSRLRLTNDLSRGRKIALSPLRSRIVTANCLPELRIASHKIFRHGHGKVGAGVENFVAERASVAHGQRLDGREIWA